MDKHLLLLLYFEFAQGLIHYKMLPFKSNIM